MTRDRHAFAIENSGHQDLREERHRRALLEGLGLTIAGAPQVWRLSGTIDGFDLSRGVFRFAPSELLRKHLGNATVIKRGEARSIAKPEKLDRRTARKVDAAVALLCAYAALQAAPAGLSRQVVKVF